MRYGSERFNSGGSTARVARIIRHPQYVARTDNNDITLLKLNSFVLFNNRARSISIAGRQPSNGSLLKVTGWGNTSVSIDLGINQTLNYRDFFLVHLLGKGKHKQCIDVRESTLYIYRNVQSPVL